MEDVPRHIQHTLDTVLDVSGTIPVRLVQEVCAH